MRGAINSAQSGPNSRGNALSDSDLEVAIVRVLQNRLNLSTQNIQRLQELTGDRKHPTDTNRLKAAVRRGELVAIGNMNPMKSQVLTAAPTMADYNALRADVLQIFTALEDVMTAINSAFST